VNFLLLADLFLFGILLAVTANLRAALLLPLVFDIGVLALTTTRATRILLAAMLVPIGILLGLLGIPWGSYIAVVGLLISLTFAGDKRIKK
jgi:hypothetical protein